MSHSFSPAAERNKAPIFTVLDALLATEARVLEVGSGTGQHAEYFLSKRPDLAWTATELPERVPELSHRLSRLETGTLRISPLHVGQSAWCHGTYDAIFTANTLHIMSWPSAVQVFQESSGSLSSDGHLICYGPFHEGGRHNSDSNLDFDRSLQARDPAMGLRDMLELRAIANSNHLSVVAEISMPANNRLLVFKRY